MADKNYGPIDEGYEDTHMFTDPSDPDGLLKLKKDSRDILILGDGHKTMNEFKTKMNRIYREGEGEPTSIVSVDIDPSRNPDVIWDLNQHPLPFEDNSFDEIHAYEVLEHLGRQGDYEEFFKEFNDYYRILRPLGLLCASVPRWGGIWAWGDPGHTRVINRGTLAFLNKENYLQCGPNSPMTNYLAMGIMKCDFATKYYDFTKIKDGRIRGSGHFMLMSNKKKGE